MVTRSSWCSPLALFVVVVFGTATGCTTSLAGKWDGEVDCGSWGDVDIAIDLDDAQGNVFTGDGEITGFYYDNSPAELQFEVEVTKSKLAGVQDLDIEPDECEVRVSGLGTFDSDCEEPDKVEWDGENVITGELEDFLGIAGNDCDFEVER